MRISKGSQLTLPCAPSAGSCSSPHQLHNGSVPNGATAQVPYNGSFTPNGRLSELLTTEPNVRKVTSNRYNTSPHNVPLQVGPSQSYFGREQSNLNNLNYGSLLENARSSSVEGLYNGQLRHSQPNRRDKRAEQSVKRRSGIWN